MLAISIHQPYASWIARGRKTLEIRCWRMHHRGPLLVCSTAKEPVLPLPEDATEADFPTGVAIAMVDVIDCRPMTPADAQAACVDFRDGMFAVALGNPRPTKHLPVSGKQRLYQSPYDVKQLGVG